MTTTTGPKGVSGPWSRSLKLYRCVEIHDGVVACRTLFNEQAWHRRSVAKRFHPTGFLLAVLNLIFSQKLGPSSWDLLRAGGMQPNLLA